MKLRSDWWMLIAVATTTVVCLSATNAATPSEAASVTGPIVVTAQSGEPYRGANEQPVAGPGLPIPALGPYGYVEEEYFVSGTIDGKPYRTSLLVRKPQDAKKFSGLVAVETIHSAGAIPFWGMRNVWLPAGHGWAAVASQRSALETHLKKANRSRYESLQIPEMAAPPGPFNPMGGGPQDVVSQAIMTQVGALLKSNPKEGPFAGMQVKYLLMGGSSQTGGTTIRYIQDSHAIARMPDGRPIYDGYSPGEAFSDKPISAGDAAVIHPVGEGDLMFFGASKRPMTLRDDGDSPSDRYRHYQFTGASHVVTRGVTDPKVVFSTLTNALKPGEQLNQFPMAPLYENAARHLVDWVMKGTAPPKAPRIEMESGAIVRDVHGNAKGGVRSPYVDVPTVRYIASAPTDQSNMMRGLIGLQEPFAPEKMRSLYKTRDNYLKLFSKGIDKMIAERWIIAADGEKLKAEEAKLTPQFP
jgi:Alpha/beta hydrolase domain